jgi:ABC-type glycerol-3-phosphate transport system permease component
MNTKKVTKKQLRTFGIALSVFLGGIGLIHFLKGHTPQNLWFWGAAIIILLITLVVPLVINPIYTVAIFIAHKLGWINTRIILGLIYYLLFTPASLIMKLVGKDPLNRKFDKEAKTYWSFRAREPIPKEQYLRQF